MIVAAAASNAPSKDKFFEDLKRFWPSSGHLLNKGVKDEEEEDDDDEGKDYTPEQLSTMRPYNFTYFLW